MKQGDFCMLADDVPIALKAIHGSAAVLEVENVIGGVVFLKHTHTQQEFILNENQVCRLSDEDADIQSMIYQEHIKRFFES